jgi:putative tryptophan/tyrosine transport system substrate-binding protein
MMHLGAFTLALTLLAPALAAETQQAERVYRVGIILTTSPVAEMAGPEPAHPAVRAFVREMRALGLVEGQNLVLERRSADHPAEPARRRRTMKAAPKIR